jgi:acetyl-CoA carboxylase carboxyl transferase subunit alpha
VYTVATPEACAAILWKDSKLSKEAAEALKITALDLKILNIIDKIVTEPVGGAQFNPLQSSINLKEILNMELNRLCALSSKELKDLRYKKFRSIGSFYE